MQGKHFIVIFHFLPYVGHVSGQCDGRPLNLDVGFTTVSISPPGFPIYDKNLSCDYLATATSEGDRLLFRVTNMGLRCPDTMAVFQGSDTTGPVLARFECDSTEKDLVFNIAPLGRIFVRFTSDVDQDASETGFDLHMISGQDFSGTGCRRPQQLTATTEKQYLTSPNFPLDYPSFTGCIWEITAPGSDGHVILEVEFMMIEFVNFCFYDFLEIQDETGNVVAKLCEEDVQKVWNPKKNYTSPGNKFKVLFLSDGANEFHGFVLSYRTNSSVNNGIQIEKLSTSLLVATIVIISFL